MEVPISLTPLDPTVSTDYVLGGLTNGGNLTFNVGDTFKTFTITASQDTDNLDERVRLEFGAPTDLLGGGGSRHSDHQRRRSADRTDRLSIGYI